MARAGFDEFDVTCASSPSASVYTLGTALPGLGKYDYFTVDATLGGGGGGTMDVVLLRKVNTNDWREWARFPQVAANATKRYTFQPTADGAIYETQSCADATPPTTFTLPVDTHLGGHPGEAVKLCVLTGTGASAAVTQTVRLKCWQQVK